jgi:tetraacyldisaccharide 4'-kinase
MSLDAVARRWWDGELGAAGHLLGALLAPAEGAFRFAVAARNRAYAAGLLGAERVDVPVISVGNISVGGTGKTPFAHRLAVLLAERGRRPAILHGGYAADEPALHRRWSPDIPVVVERDRVRGAAQAIARGADVLVLDDGFQHRRLHRDLDIVLVAAERWTDRPRLLPRGPWREPPAALARAGLVVVTRKTGSPAAARDVAAAAAGISGGPVSIVHLRADRWLHGGVHAAAPAEPALLVTAVAEPRRVAEAARQAGAVLAAELPFPDHHEYDAGDVARIRAAAGPAPIVTTEKDWTKLDRWLDPAGVWLLAQEVVVEEGAPLIEACVARVLA